MIKVAIVGSQGKYWSPEQRTKVISKIMDIFWKCSYKQYRKKHGTDMFMEDQPMYITLVSGGCGSRSEGDKQKFDGGVDVWAEIVATVMNIPKKIYYSGTFSKDAFARRNHEIAMDCDVLYCIDPAWRDWSGGQWTMKMAKGLGKEVHLELIE